MARPREFNEQVALDQALQVFWKNGYEATSLQDLTDAMEISKSSFYDTFSSKHGLFLTCLDLYAKSNVKWIWSVLENERSARACIESVFQHVIDVVIEDDDRRGCFLGNCAVEVGQHDKEVEKRVADGFARFTEAFVHALQRGLDSGEFTSVKDTQSVARYLVSNLNGLRITAMASSDRKQLEGVVQIMMSTIH